MMADRAPRADWLGPSGFSFESIMTPSLEIGRRAAAASMGSVTTWKPAKAEAAAESCRNERREKGERFWTGMVPSGSHLDIRSQGPSLRQIIDQPVWISDVASWKLRFVLNHPAALFLEPCFGFLDAFDGNFQNRSKSRTSFNEEIDVWSVEAD